MANKKILFISYDGMTDPLGQSQVIPYLTNLTKFGYAFTILSCDKADTYEANKEYIETLMHPFPLDGYRYHIIKNRQCFLLFMIFMH